LTSWWSATSFLVSSGSEPIVCAQLGRAVAVDGYVESRLEDAGTHLSFVGGADLIRSKWQAYSFQH
jgi:hypothetical protein